MKFFKRILLSEKTLVLADQIIFSGSTFLLTLAMARLLGQKEFGLFSGITLAIYLFLSVSNAIVIQPLQVSLFKVKDSGKYLAFSLYLQLAIILSFVLIVALLFQTGYSQQYKFYLLPVCLYLGSFLLHDYFRKSFLANGECAEALLIDAVSALSQLACLLLFWEFGQRDLYSLLTYISLTYIPSLVFSLFKQNYKWLSLTEISSFLKNNFEQGFWLIMVSILQWSSSNFFTLVSGVFIGLEALGALRLAQSLFGILNILLQTFENYVLPKASRLYHRNVQNSKKYLRKITLQSSVIFLPILLLLFLFPEYAMNLIGGKKYIEFSYVIKLLSILYAIIYVGYPIRIGIRLLVVNKSFFIGYLISFVFSIISFKYLLQHGNLTGAVAGLVINQVLMLIYWQYTLHLRKFSIWK